MVQGICGNGSCDSNPNDNKNGTFDLLFGSIHRFYGMMDVTGIRNMHGPNANVSWRPVKGLLLKLDHSAYWLADNRDLFFAESRAGRPGNGYGRNPRFGGSVGQQIDFMIDDAVTPIGRRYGAAQRIWVISTPPLAAPQAAVPPGAPTKLAALIHRSATEFAPSTPRT